MRSAKVSLKHTAKLLYFLVIWSCSIAGADTLASELLPQSGVLRTLCQVVAFLVVVWWPWALLYDARDGEASSPSA
jgi:hypothetical protein